MEENNKKMQFEDVYSDSSKEKEKPAYQRGHKPLDQREICYPNKFFEFLLKNNKRNTKIILAAMIVLILLMVGALVGSSSGTEYPGLVERDTECVRCKASFGVEYCFGWKLYDG